MERNYYLLAFESTHGAMEAERTLSARFPVVVMPTLRQITVSCGISLRVEERDCPALLEALAEPVLKPGAFQLYHVEDRAVRRLELKQGKVEF